MNALEHLAKKPDVATWQRPEMQAALADRDVTKVFQLLQRVGYSQQRIAALTGQSQPEVSAIIHGRKVMAYDVLLRVADGLGIPRGLAGMSLCRCPDSGADQGDEPPAVPVGHSAAEADRAGDATSENSADDRSELALQTPAGLCQVSLRSARPLPEGAVRRYLEEGRTLAVVGIVNLAQSHLPALDGHGAGSMAVLVEIPSLAQISGDDASLPPLVLLADIREGQQPA